MQNAETAKNAKIQPAKCAKLYPFYSSRPLRNSLRPLRLSFLRFLFALLLGLGFSQMVFAQNKDTTIKNPFAGVKHGVFIGPAPDFYYNRYGQKVKADSINFDSISDGENVIANDAWEKRLSEEDGPYNQFLNQEYTNDFNRPEELYHSCLRSYVHTGFRPFWGYQSYSNGEWILLFHPDEWHSWSWFHRKVYPLIFERSLFVIRDTASKFFATIDPLFNFQASMDHSDSNKKYFQNTRGILIRGRVGEDFAFSSIFWENQASLPYYLNKYVQENYVIPGNGRPKSFGVNSYDYSMSEAYLSFAPSRHFSIQGGYGKNFIGDGYRSLLLSDNSFAYPYIRATTTFWHLQYTNLYTEFMDPFADPSTTVGNVEGLIQRKAGAFQYLSWCNGEGLELGLFQGMIWTAADQYNHQSFNFNYFDPVIGVNALNYGLANTNNVLLGSTIKCNFGTLTFYGQFVADDFPQNADLHSFYNRTGYQAGFKYFFGGRSYPFELQVEYNQVRPYTYSSSDSLQNYSHYDQALGDPLGANFKELIGIFNWHSHRFSIHLQGNYALEGLDSNGTNYGNNIFLPDTKANLTSTNVQMLQGVRSTLMYMDVHVSYLMNPRTNMNFTVGVSRRTLTNSLNNQPAMTLIYVGFRTSIENMYTDF